MARCYTPRDDAPFERGPSGRVRADRRISGSSWEQYEALLDLRGDVAGPRISYLDGVVELADVSERLPGLDLALLRTFFDR